MTQDATPALGYQTVQLQVKMKTDPGHAVMHVNFASAIASQHTMYLDFGMLNVLEVQEALAQGEAGKQRPVIEVPAQIRLAVPMEAMAQLVVAIQQQLSAFGMAQQGGTSK